MEVTPPHHHHTTSTPPHEVAHLVAAEVRVAADALGVTELLDRLLPHRRGRLGGGGALGPGEGVQKGEGRRA